MARKALRVTRGTLADEADRLRVTKRVLNDLTYKIDYLLPLLQMQVLPNGRLQAFFIRSQWVVLCRGNYRRFYYVPADLRDILLMHGCV